MDADDRADRHKLLAVRRMSGGVRQFERQFQVDGDIARNRSMDP